jgi:hypothetical protein
MIFIFGSGCSAAFSQEKRVFTSSVKKMKENKTKRKLKLRAPRARAGSSRCTARQGVGSPSCLPLYYIV